MKTKATPEEIQIINDCATLIVSAIVYAHLTIDRDLGSREGAELTAGHALDLGEAFIRKARERNMDPASLMEAVKGL